MSKIEVVKNLHKHNRLTSWGNVNELGICDNIKIPAYFIQTQLTYLDTLGFVEIHEPLLVSDSYALIVLNRTFDFGLSELINCKKNIYRSYK